LLQRNGAGETAISRKITVNIAFSGQLYRPLPIDFSQVQHHVTHRQLEFVRDKAVAPHWAHGFALSDRAAPDRPAL
jgi:hypothetical protein